MYFIIFLLPLFLAYKPGGGGHQTEAGPGYYFGLIGPFLRWILWITNKCTILKFARPCGSALTSSIMLSRVHFIYRKQRIDLKSNLKHTYTQILECEKEKKRKGTPLHWKWPAKILKLKGCHFKYIEIFQIAELLNKCNCHFL